MLCSSSSKQCPLLMMMTFVLVHHQTTSDNADNRIWKAWPGMVKPNFTQAGIKYFESLGTKPNDISSRSGGIPGTRRELRCLSTQERNNLFSALQQLKNNFVGKYSEYDQLQVRHTPLLSPGAHGGPSFFGWHREFLAEAERGVKKYCPNCMMPYWDNRLDARLGSDPGYSVIFLDIMMGNPRGIVTTGFAANWKSTGSSECASISKVLQRNLQNDLIGFYSDATVDYYRKVKNYKELVTPWNDDPEFKHADMHAAFGFSSHMVNTSCSPLDPIFYLHHSFVDYCYEQARQSLKKYKMLEYPTVPNNYQVSAGDVLMKPFSITNEFGAINDYYTRDVYKYETAPGDVKCSRDEDCCANGYKEFLWCNSAGKCVSKARVGARVKAGYPANACYCSSGTPAVVSFVCKCQ